MFVCMCVAFTQLGIPHSWDLGVGIFGRGGIFGGGGVGGGLTFFEKSKKIKISKNKKNIIKIWRLSVCMCVCMYICVCVAFTQLGIPHSWDLGVGIFERGGGFWGGGGLGGGV